MKTFLRALKASQKQSGLPQQDFIRLVGVGDSTYRDWLAGRRKPSAESMTLVYGNMLQAQKRQSHVTAAIDNFLNSF